MNDQDDEVTTDVDPEWIAAIRAEAAAPPQGEGSDTTTDEATDGTTTGPATPGEQDQDWFDPEPDWDAEATVGASSGLLDRIRSEIADGSGTPRSDGPAGPTEAEASVAAQSPPPTPHAEPAASAPADPAPTPFAPPAIAQPTEGMPPPATPDTTPSTDPVDSAVSTTVRWEPRQRLTASAPVKPSMAITDEPRHTGLDRTKVAIALIAAITVILIVWFIVRSGGSDDVPPADTVPGSSIASDVEVPTGADE